VHRVWSFRPRCAALRKQSRRTADELVGYLNNRTGKGFARGGNPEDVAQALAVLRVEIVPAVEMLVAQEWSARYARRSSRASLMDPGWGQKSIAQPAAENSRFQLSQRHNPG
jgi:hypothetical protein